jgi:hypothetical protein
MAAPSPLNESAIAALLERVQPGYRGKCELMLRGKAATFAQAWQDWYLFMNIFGHDDKASSWGGGVYVDIGTNEATQISNTLFFDKCLGWRGVCFEPQTRYHEKIRRMRSCQLVPRCVVGSGTSTHGHMEGAAGSTRFVRDASSTDRQPPEGAAASAAASAVSAPGTVADDEATSANGGECVHADKVLPHRLGAGTRIDLLSIDMCVRDFHPARARAKAPHGHRGRPRVASARPPAPAAVTAAESSLTAL